MSSQTTATRSAITEYLKIVVAGVVTIGTVVGAVYGVTFWVNTLVDNRVQSDEVIKKIANRIRPYVIFNAKESILADMGGMGYLDSIHVKDVSDSPGSAWEYTITVTPKQFLSDIPVLQLLESYDYTIATTRGPGYQIIYKIGISGMSTAGEVPPEARFRLEILS